MYILVIDFQYNATPAGPARELNIQRATHAHQRGLGFWGVLGGLRGFLRVFWEVLGGFWGVFKEQLA